MTELVINPFNRATITAAIKAVKAYKRWVIAKETALRLRLASIGVEVARVAFAGAIYDGTNDVIVRLDDTGSVATVYAEGKSVAFIEFGSGAKFGGGHPMGAELGFFPGSWSLGEEGKGHWNDPNGWYYAHDKKSHGNPPAMAMIAARDEMEARFTAIAREVFSK